MVERWHKRAGLNGRRRRRQLGDAAVPRIVVEWMCFELIMALADDRP